MDYTRFFDQDGKGTHDVLSFKLVFSASASNWMQRVQNCFDRYSLCGVPGAEIHYLAEKTVHNVSSAHFAVTVPKNTNWIIWMPELVRFSNLLGRAEFRVSFNIFDIEFFTQQDQTHHV